MAQPRRQTGLQSRDDETPNDETPSPPVHSSSSSTPDDNPNAPYRPRLGLIPRSLVPGTSSSAQASVQQAPRSNSEETPPSYIPVVKTKLTDVLGIEILFLKVARDLANSDVHNLLRGVIPRIRDRIRDSKILRLRLCDNSPNYPMVKVLDLNAEKTLTFAGSGPQREFKLCRTPASSVIPIRPCQGYALEYCTKANHKDDFLVCQHCVQHAWEAYSVFVVSRGVDLCYKCSFAHKQLSRGETPEAPRSPALSESTESLANPQPEKGPQLEEGPQLGENTRSKKRANSTESTQSAKERKRQRKKERKRKKTRRGPAPPAVCTCFLDDVRLWLCTTCRENKSKIDMERGVEWCSQKAPKFLYPMHRPLGKQRRFPSDWVNPTSRKGESYCPCGETVTAKIRTYRRNPYVRPDFERLVRLCIFCGQQRFVTGRRLDR